MRKKRFRPLPWLILIAVAIGFYLVVAPKGPFPLLRSNHTPSKLAKMAQVPRLQPREVIPVAPSAEVEASCVSFWTEIQKLDLEELGYPPKLERLPSPGGCAKEPEMVKSVQANYEKYCTPLFSSIPQPASEKEWKDQLGICPMYLYFLRAGISSWQTRDQKLADITDMRVLADRLIYGFSKLFGEKLDSRDLVAVGNRMLELDPTLYGAAKAVLAGEFIGMSGQFDAHRGDAEFWNQFAGSLQRAYDLNADDTELEQIRFAIQTHGFDPPLIKAEAERMVATNPSSSQGYDLLGYAEWKAGNHDAAWQALQKAMSLDPENSKLKEIWEKTHSHPDDSGSYSHDVTLGINFDSLWK